jgi:hypothetical protein
VYRWIVFLHLAGIFGFLLSHGSSAGVAFALRRERKPERIRALLHLSSTALPVFYASLLVLIAAGIAGAFAGHWWGRGWLWASIALLIAMIAGMWTVGTRHYHRVRKAVGMPYMEGTKFLPALPEQADPAALQALLARGRPMLLASIGYGGALVIAGLMWFKPF